MKTKSGLKLLIQRMSGGPEYLLRFTKLSIRQCIFIMLALSLLGMICGGGVVVVVLKVFVDVVVQPLGAQSLS